MQTLQSFAFLVTLIYFPTIKDTEQKVNELYLGQYRPEPIDFQSKVFATNKKYFTNHSIPENQPFRTNHAVSVLRICYRYTYLIMYHIHMYVCVSPIFH